MSMLSALQDSLCYTQRCKDSVEESCSSELSSWNMGDIHCISSYVMLVGLVCVSQEDLR